MKLEDVKNSNSAQGKTFLLKHLKGERITRGQAIFAKCYECNNGYLDGRKDCGMPDCPLYPFSPYRKNIRSEGAQLHDSLGAQLHDSRTAQQPRRSTA